MLWILFLLIGGLIFAKVLRYRANAASDAITIGTLMPNRAEHAATKKRREFKASQQLQELGLSLSSTSGNYTFALPHAQMPLSLTISSTVTNSTIKVQGTIPADSPFRALEVVSGYHTETIVGGPQKSCDLFTCSDLHDEVFDETPHHKTTQCRIGPHGKFDLTVQLAQDAQLDIACAWLERLQQAFTRPYERWQEALRRHVNAPRPGLATRAMRYLLTWHPELIDQLRASSDQLNDWAHIDLLAHLHANTELAMAPHSISHVESLLARPGSSDELKLHVLNLCVNTPASRIEQTLCSDTFLLILSHRAPPTAQALDILVGLPHPDASLCAMIDAVMDATQMLNPPRALEIIEFLLHNPWDHISSRRPLHDYYTSSHAEFSPLTMVMLSALFSSEMNNVASYTRLHLSRKLLPDTPYVMWERLIIHRADDLLHEVDFLQLLAQQIAAKRQRHMQLCRLLIVHLGHAPAMPAMLHKLIPTTEPHTAAGWIRCAALIVEHLVAHPPMLEIILELLPMCPSEDTARRVAAQLPRDAPEVQDFLMHWTLTPRSARHALLNELAERNEELSMTRLHALITLLTHKQTGHIYHEQVLALIATLGPIESIKMLHELQQHAHARTFQKPLQQAIELLLVRFNAQGGELSLSHDSRKGALSLNDTPEG